jgi:hypothetical protein
MTDYASQGKTRPYNVVNLSHCKNFQSIYTCLSRSSNAAGTLIVQGFNSAKITQGLSGHLRQEFRELNLLNNITMKIYERHISKLYAGPLRNPMIYKYQTDFQVKNETHNWHPALKCADNELFIAKTDSDGTWNLEIYKNLVNSTTIKKIDTQATSNKNSNYSVNSSGPCSQSPKGLTWDSNDYSCAYDSLFTVLHHMWNEGQINHKTYFERGTQYLQLLHSKFYLLSTNQCTFELIRNELRLVLNNKKPNEYQFGRKYTNLDELVRDFTLKESHGTSKLQCLECNFTVYKQYSYFQDYTSVGWSSSEYEELQHRASIQQYLNFKIIKMNEKTNKKCPDCFRSRKKDFPLYTTQYINKLPAILIFALAPWIDINRTLMFNISGSSKHYILKGIIYTNGNHFTARLIDKDYIIWYHDGQTTYSSCQRQQSLMRIENDQLKTYNEQYKAIMAFYAEEDGNNNQ